MSTMASEQTNDVGIGWAAGRAEDDHDWAPICWMVPNPGDVGPYYCETCGPVALRERALRTRAKGGPVDVLHVGADPRYMPADAICARCGFGLRGKVPVLEAKLVGRGKERRWRVWCVFCDVYHYHHQEPEPGFRIAHCGHSSPYIETGYFLRPRANR